MQANNICKVQLSDIENSKIHRLIFEASRTTDNVRFVITHKPYIGDEILKRWQERATKAMYAYQEYRNELLNKYFPTYSSNCNTRFDYRFKTMEVKS